MTLARVRTGLAALAVGLLLGLSGGCGVREKIDQCNEVVRTINDGLAPIDAQLKQTPSLRDGGAGHHQYGTLAGSYESAAKKLAGLQISHRRLQSVVKSYRTVYEASATACRKYAEGVQKSHTAMQKSASKELGRQKSREASLKKRLKAVCSG